MRRGASLLALLLIATGGCAATPRYDKADCQTYTEIGLVRVNPAGALDRHFSLEAVFKVCPPDEGLEEIQRKRIELKHNLLSLLSSKSEEELKDPLRAEKLRSEILLMANEKVLKRGRVIDVFITSMELE